MPANVPDPGVPRCALPEKGSRRVETGGVPSGADGATTKERQPCAHRQVSEAAGPPLRFSMKRERSWRTFSASC